MSSRSVVKKQGIDLTLISGRRASLIERTLGSFSGRLFRHFKVENVLINVDPFGGDANDHYNTVKVIRDFFPTACITEPSVPSFGKAVQEVWSRSSSEFIFHLEDDWIIEEDLLPDDVFPLFKDATAAIQPVCKQHDWDGNIYKTHIKTEKFFGLPFRKTTYNIFGTSPGFWRGEVARTAASLMNTDLDPEKQMRPSINRKLFSYLNDYRCRMLPGKNSRCLITDIGREWRDQQGIKKKTENGKSIWVNEYES